MDVRKVNFVIFFKKKLLFLNKEIIKENQIYTK